MSGGTSISFLSLGLRSRRRRLRVTAAQCVIPTLSVMTPAASTQISMSLSSSLSGEDASRSPGSVAPARCARSISRGGLVGLIGLCAMGAAPSAYANCFDDAAAYQHVNPLILRAIAWQESRNRPDAKHVNANGSVDYGVMQINTVHLPTLAQYGIGREALMSPCKNIYIAAWQLRRQINRYGNTWAAVGAYHSATPALRDEYARQIAAILRRWGMLAPDRSGTATSARASSRAVSSIASE